MLLKNKLTTFALLLLSPLATHAVDSTQQLRGKENDLGNLSLSTGEEESSHLSHIPHDSSILDEAQVQEVESTHTRRSNNLKNDFLKQMKMVSDQKLPNESDCTHSDECQSGRCAYLATGQRCLDKVSTGGDCFQDVDCWTGYCSSRKCAQAPNGHPCEDRHQCASLTCSNAGTCACFSSETLVTHSERGLIPISEIEVGDYIESDTHGSFSRVYALKKNHYKEIEFYQLHSSKGGIPLEVTDRHMVFLKNKVLPIAARDVRVGDVLKSDKPEDDAEVTKIKIIRREGYYSPFTESGTLILNGGVVASSYDVSSSSSSDFFDTETELIHWHTLAHFACAPLRFVCKTMNFDVCSDADNQNEEGLHKFILFLTTLRKLKDWQQVAVVPIVMIMGVIFTVFDLVYDKAEALLEVASSTGVGAGLLTFSLITALAVPRMLVLRKRYLL